MTIKELIDKIKSYCANEQDEKRILNLIKLYKKEMFLTDLDLGLLLIACGWYSLLEKEYLDAVIDSKYITIFVGQDCQNMEIMENKFYESFMNNKITPEIINKILEHEVSNKSGFKSVLNTENSISSLRKSISIDCEVSSIYSFALSQTNYEILKSITLNNQSKSKIQSLKVVITCEPNFIQFSDILINELPIEQPILLNNFNYHIDYNALLRLNEKQIGDLIIKLYYEDQEINTITKKIEYYSYNTLIEGLIPNSCAFFVTPNVDAVNNIIRLTAKQLQMETGKADLNDYQSDSKELVYNQVKALYNVLHNQGIGYITVPPSYENVGQKIRLPHSVIVGKQGTCIDLTILFVSCLEAMGLNSGIVYVYGHAFACVFLEKDCFTPSPYRDAVHAVDMCENEKNLLFINCVDFVAGNKYTFEESCERGKKLVINSESDPYFFIVDMMIARASGYLPLPICYDADKVKVDLDVVEQNKIKIKRQDLNHKNEKIVLTEKELNKFDIWEKRLLDLTKRNELIDFKLNRYGQQLITFEAEDGVTLDRLFETFRTKGNQYTLVDSQYEINNGTLEMPILTEEGFETSKLMFKSKKIALIKRKTDHETALKYFDRERRKALEESGSNIFYLVLGFIEWFENDRTVKPIYSPVILVPIDLKKHTNNKYSIVGRDEQAFLNISIFEFFHQEFKLNFDDLLSQDLFSKETVNIDAILNTVNEKLKHLPRTRILKVAAINIFRFSKAVMWQTIKYNQEELVKNKVIKSIIDKTYLMDKDDKLSTNYDDDNSNPINMAIPLSADSSQIKAIQDCENGKSFILQGPPGTGKSQTITNMIVNAIYHGKTVLFVAEKMAALEVVQNRLASLNLDRFALEAHSIKADKASVMEQFKRRIELQEIVSDSQKYRNTCEALKSTRCDINKIINILHKSNNYFMSFYDAFVNFLAIRNKSIVKVNDEYIESLTEEKFAYASTLMDNIYYQVMENGGYINSPFILMRKTEYIPNVTKNLFKDYMQRYSLKLSQFNKQLKEFINQNNIIFLEKRTIIKPLIALLKDERIKNADETLINSTLLVENSDLFKTVEKGLEYQNQKNIITKEFYKKIFSIDYETLLFEFQKYNNCNFLLRIFKKAKLINSVSQYAYNPKTIKINYVKQVLDNLAKINNLHNDLDNSFKKYSFYFSGDIDNFNYLSFKEMYLNTLGIKNDYSELLSKELIANIIKKYNSNSLAFAKELIDAYEEVAIIENELVDKFNFDFSLCNRYNINYYEIEERVNESIGKIDNLRNWCYLVKNINDAQENKMNFMITFLEHHNNDSLSEVYKKSIYYTIMSKALMSDANAFNSSEIKQKIKKFENLIDDFSKLCVIETASRISKSTPIINEKTANTSEIGILRNAIANKCRGKSIRQLFSETKNVLTKYFPVFLMSPISCAQYLSSDMPLFDIVIFDEASQMPTCEAICSIARGKSLIVVGDSMQLPPTSFFQTKTNMEEYIDISDQESILDDCDVIGMPSRQLKWHYRSKHESLIRFSNAHFYNNSLVTFPSPNDMETKVTMRNVNGIYDRKNTNTNSIEAIAIINEIKRRLLDDNLCKMSIGVVTFSSSQQNLIEDKLESLLLANKKLQERYNSQKEKIIIKNLENIQGDERDVILFSVCYGPNADGKMYYQFGPINQVGGEKRLNVAFSRARYEMIIFTSFDPSLLANMNSDSKGAQELYSFLKYAYNGGNYLPISTNSVNQVKVGMELDLAEKLEEKGYKVNINVGKSTFRVDIGVINPNNENEYILGIICDSYSYESAQTARDRNVVQPSVLKNLGWNIMRIWSFDYLDDKNACVNAIIKKIKDIQNNPQKYKMKTIASNQDIHFEIKELKEISYSKKYQKYEKRIDISNTKNASELLNMVKASISDILKVESPININLLYSRIAESMDNKYSVSTIKSVIDKCLNSMNVFQNMTLNNKFLWAFYEEEMKSYRINDEFISSFYNVCKEEVLVAIKEVLVNSGTVEINELIKMVSKRFGLQMLVPKAKETITYVVNYYIDMGVLSKSGTHITLIK